MSVLNTLSLTAIRGDLWELVIPFTRLDPTDRTPDLALRRRVPLSAAEVASIAAAYPGIDLTARTGTKDTGYTTVLHLTAEDGELEISVPLLGLRITGPTKKMTGFVRSSFDVQFSNPRVGNTLGPDKKTWIKGDLTLLDDITP